MQRDSCLYRPPACSASTSRGHKKLPRLPRAERRARAQGNSSEIEGVLPDATPGVVSVVRNCQHEVTKIVSSYDTYSRARPNAQHVDRPRGTRCLGTAVTRQPGKTRVHFHPCKRNSVSENSVIEIVPSKNIDKIPSKRCIENSPPLQRRVRSLPGAVQRDAEVAHELKTNYPESRAARTRSLTALAVEVRSCAPNLGRSKLSLCQFSRST
jgi:hypothetical protein